jgi:hypothetical protein
LAVPPLAPFFQALAALPPGPVEDDIVFSLACGRRHVAVDVEPVEEMGWDDEHAIWRRPDHFERRQRAVDFMRARAARSTTGPGSTA